MTPLLPPPRVKDTVALRNSRPAPRVREMALRNCQPERGRGHELPRLQELESAVQRELAAIRGQERLFLRATSELTLLMKKMSRHNGRAYFRYVLRDVFGDKSDLLHDPTAPHGPDAVRAYARSILQRLSKAIHFAPLVLRAGCHYMLSEFRKAFPTCRQDTTIVVGNLLFLRIVCPALVKPEMFGFAPHSPKSLPVGVQVAKLLQHAVSGSPVGDQVADARESNLFIASAHPTVAAFLVRFAQLRSCAFPRDVPRFPERVRLPSASSAWDLDSARQPEHGEPSLELPDSPPPGQDRDGGDWDLPPRKMRGLSLSADESLKTQKRKFRLRFWSREPAVSMSS